MIKNIKFFSEISGSLFAMVTRTIVGFISIPLFIKYLGPERYGLWMIALSTLTFINFLDAGIFPSIKNKLTEFYSKKDLENFNLYLYSGFIFGAFLLFIAFILSFGILLIDVNSFLNINDPVAQMESKPLFIVLLFILILNVSLSNVENFYASKILLGKIKFVEGILTLLIFGITVLVLIYKDNLVLVAFLYALPALLLRLILLFYLIITGEIKILPFKESIFVLKSELKPSLSFMGIKIAEMIIVFIPNFYIARFYSLTEVTHYNVVYKFISIPLILITAVLPAIWPMLTLAWNKGDKIWIKKIIHNAILITIVGFVLFLTISMFWGIEIIYYLTSNTITTNNTFIFLIGISSLILGMVYWVSTFLHSITDFKFEFKIHLLVAFSISILGDISIRFAGINAFILIISFSWLILAFVPMYIRSMNFLNK